MSKLTSNARIPLEIYDNISIFKRFNIKHSRVLTATRTTAGVTLATIILFFVHNRLLNGYISCLMGFSPLIILGISSGIGGTVYMASHMVWVAILSLIASLSDTGSAWGENILLSIIVLIFSIADSPFHKRSLAIKNFCMLTSSVLIFRREGSEIIPILMQPPVAMLLSVAASLPFFSLSRLSTFELPKEMRVALHNCGIYLENIIDQLDCINNITHLSHLTNNCDNHSTKLDEEVSKKIVVERCQRNLQKKISYQLLYINNLVKESKNEIWIEETLRNELEAVFLKIDDLFSHLLTLNKSIRDGFILLQSNHIIPLMRHIKKTVSIMVQYLSSMEDQLSNMFTDNIQSKRDLTYYSLKLDQLSKKIMREYYLTIKSLQRQKKLQYNPTPDMCRMGYFIWSFMNTRHKLKIVNGMINVFDIDSKKYRSHGYELMNRAVFPMLYMFVIMYRDFISVIKYIVLSLYHSFSKKKEVDLDEIESNNQSKIRDKYYCFKRPEWTKHGRWKFPFRVTITFFAVTSACLILKNYIPQESKLQWVQISAIITVVPSLGATLKRGIHRMVGTVFGALIGQLFVIYSAKTIQYACIGPIILVTFITTYIQHDLKNPRPYSWVIVSVTFYLILLYPYPYKGDIGWSLAGLRLLMVLIGILLAVLFSLLFWDRTLVSLNRSCEETVDDSVSLYSDFLSLVFDDPGSIHNITNDQRLRTYLQVDLLKDAKAELSFDRKRRNLLKKFVPMIKYLRDILTSMFTNSTQGFPEKVMEFVLPVKPLMDDIVEAIESEKEIVKRFIKCGKKKEERQDPNIITNLLRNLDKKYYDMRRNYKNIWQLLPGLTKWHAYLYDFREYAIQFDKILEMITKKKKNEV